jgi:nucleoid-associated protein YgaU
MMAAHVNMNRSIRLGLLPVALALATTLRADDAPAAAAPAAAPAQDDATALRADNKQLTEELAASWKETDKLKSDLAAAQAANTKSEGDAADLKAQLDAAKAQPAPAPAAAPDTSTLADTQDKLATALRSFQVLQDENAALKASVDKLTSDNASMSQQLDSAHATISTLQVQAAATSQIDPLRTELRQAQDEASQLANENSQLRTKLSLQGVGPSSLKPVPMRPGTPEAAAAAAPIPTPTPVAPETKTYVVAEGDTLTKISRKFYGSSSHWEEILKANHDVMKDEKSLVVGSTIKIP